MRERDLTRDRTSRRAVVVGAALAALALAGCGDDTPAGADASVPGDDATGATDDAATPATDEEQQDLAELRASGFAFDPAEVTLGAGETLAIVNDDELAHTVTAVDGAFDVVVEAGGEARLTLNASGTHRFACELHPQMTGRLIVE